MKAVVRKFSPDAQFGFAVTDEGEEVLVRQIEVVDGSRLRPGLRIEVDEIEETPDGRRPVAIGISGGKDAMPMTENNGTCRGTIISFGGGWGWLRPKGPGRDVFFHHSCVLAPLAEIAVGREVESYELSRDAQGRARAVNVRLASETEKGQQDAGNGQVL